MILKKPRKLLFWACPSLLAKQDKPVSLTGPGGRPALRMRKQHQLAAGLERINTGGEWASGLWCGELGQAGPAVISRGLVKLQACWPWPPRAYSGGALLGAGYCSQTQSHTLASLAWRPPDLVSPLSCATQEPARDF